MSAPPPKKRRYALSTKAEKSEDSSTASPVRVHCIEYSDKQSKSAVPNLSLNSNLDDLLFPLTKKEFLSKCLRKQAVHITTNANMAERHSHRVHQLQREMFNLDPEMILRETSSDNIFVWLRRPATLSHSQTNKANGDVDDSNKNDPDRNGKDLIHSVEIGDVETAIALHKTAGHATYCRAPPKVEQYLVSTLLRDTGLGCGQYDPTGDSLLSLGRGEVETFISTKDHFTNWHYDFQENFTIQLSGTKRWTLCHGTIQDPLRGCTPHYAAPEAVESQLKAANLYDTKFRFGFPEDGINATGDKVSITVKPGDVLYFPAGMWHMVETIEPGVSINVSLMATNYATIASQAIQHFLLKDTHWREPVLNNEAQSAVDHLNGLLQELPNTIRELTRDGIGAEAILPPVLQHPPKFHVNEHDDADSECVEEDGPTDEMEEMSHDDEEEKKTEKQEGLSSSTAIDVDKVEDDDENDDNSKLDNDGVFDPWEFTSYPDGWTFCAERDAPELRFVRNTLASLHRMSEITDFYNKSKVPGKNCHDDTTYVLNVNFAGNETHQSAVRVVFRDNETGMVGKVYEQERGAGRDSIVLPRQDGAEQLSKFLLFHGYLLQE